MKAVRVKCVEAVSYTHLDVYKRQPVKISDTVCVIGAGNVAMDAARTAKRLGAKEVYIVYRRGAEEVPARAEEVHHAKEEGIIFKLLTNPVKIDVYKRQG